MSPKNFYMLMVLLMIAVFVFAMLYSSPNRQMVEHQKNNIDTYISDSAITASIKGKYLADDLIRGLNIHIDTEKGRVTLSGAVSSKEAKDRAEIIAKNTNGVVEMISKIEVTQQN